MANEKRVRKTRGKKRGRSQFVQIKAHNEGVMWAAHATRNT